MKKVVIEKVRVTDASIEVKNYILRTIIEEIKNEVPKSTYGVALMDVSFICKILGLSIEKENEEEDTHE